MIIERGDTGTAMFALRSGTVKISTPSADGKGAVFNVISEGAIFGEIAVLDGLPRTADAIALTDCELMVIERRDFVALIRERAEFAVKLIEVLCRRLRHTTGQLEDVMFLDLPGRLAKALLQAAENGAPSSRGKQKIALTQRHLSEMIGVSRESTNKQLRVWEKQKLIELQRGGIVILAPQALECHRLDKVSAKRATLTLTSACRDEPNGARRCRRRPGAGRTRPPAHSPRPAWRTRVHRGVRTWLPLVVRLFGEQMRAACGRSCAP